MDYNRNIHHNPDAQAWAKFFIETTKDMDREVFSDEGYMIAWFSNAMMAMHDHLYKTEIEQLREALILTTEHINLIRTRITKGGNHVQSESVSGGDAKES